MERHFDKCLKHSDCSKEASWQFMWKGKKWRFTTATSETPWIPYRRSVSFTGNVLMYILFLNDRRNFPSTNTRGDTKMKAMSKLITARTEVVTKHSLHPARVCYLVTLAFSMSSNQGVEQQAHLSSEPSFVANALIWEAAKIFCLLPD